MSAASPAQAGYTLMEVLVALVIMALAAGVALPGVSAGLRSAARHAARLSLEERVLELRRTAINSGDSYRLGHAPEGSVPDPTVHDAGLELPGGWTFKVEPSVVFFPDGACSGGIVKLTSDTGTAAGEYVIRPPLCRPKKAEPAAVARQP